MRDKLKEKMRDQVVIFDGAIGTEIYKRHFFVNVSFEGLCLTNPDVIGDIHKSYYEAGAEVLTTNTYGANRNKLIRFGLGDKVKEINEAGVRLARENSDEDTLIAGSVGPIGDTNHARKLTEDDIIEILAEHIEALEDAKADFIIFETLSSLKDTEYAFKAINKRSQIPYVLSFSVDRNAETAKGEPLSKLLKVINGKGRKPTAIGLNCGGGPESLLSVLEFAAPKIDYPLIVQPNAGIPKNVDNRLIYMTSPEYLTTYATRYIDMKVRGIGGCCGTGPEHIRDIARSIKPLSRSEFSHVIEFKETEEALCQPVPMAERSPFGKKLANGEWVKSIEITPPRGVKLDTTIAKAIQCREAGIDAINIPDGPRASSRISPIITALQIQREAKIEAVLHFCCRDKNLIGMQADLLGCSAVGINNILFITGDPPKLGDYPFASAVFDVDSIGMVEIQNRLNRGIDLGGKAIDPPTATLIGVGADPNAIDMDRELDRMRKKVAAGAEYVITQPVFAVEPLIKFIEKISDLKIPVIAGIWPLASYRNAEFMKNEVPGVVVPDDIMERMAGADTKEAQREVGIMIARESIDKIRPYVQGIQASAPFGNVNTAISVING
jgi:homocysteine S-methyltransferase